MLPSAHTEVVYRRLNEYDPLSELSQTPLRIVRPRHWIVRRIQQMGDHEFE